MIKAGQEQNARFSSEKNLEIDRLKFEIDRLEKIIKEKIVELEK